MGLIGWMNSLLRFFAISGSEDRSPTHFQLGWGDFLRAMDFSDLLEGTHEFG